MKEDQKREILRHPQANADDPSTDLATYTFYKEILFIKGSGSVILAPAELHAFVSALRMEVKLYRSKGQGCKIHFILIMPGFIFL